MSAEIGSVPTKSRSRCNVCARRRPQSSGGKCWQDLSPKLQQEVLSFLDYHSLVKCRLVSKTLKGHAEKVSEVTKFDHNLNWNPYFTEPRSLDVDSRKLLGLVHFQGASEVKKFIEGHDESETNTTAKHLEPTATTTVSGPTATNAPSSGHPPSPTIIKRPTTLPPPTAKPGRHTQCLLQTSYPKEMTSNVKPSTFKMIPSTNTLKSIQSVKMSPSSMKQVRQPPIRPKTAPSSLVKIPSTMKSLSSPVKSPIRPAQSQMKTTVKPVPAARTNATPRSSTFVKPIIPVCQLSPVLPRKPDPATLFPLGSVYIRRCTHDCDNNGHQSHKGEKTPTSDSSLDIVHWTTRLVQDFGIHLTSFTFDDGKGERSNLSFEQLHSMLSHLQNLVFLGITAGNYEHHVDYEELLMHEEEVEKLPPLPQLKIVSLGYNATYHLHMDILNAYGCQLTRFACSKYGYFLRSPFGNHMSTNNSLQKLLEFGNSILSMYPTVLSSLEELKVPVISSQCLMREVEQVGAGIGPVPMIQWSNLKRLSLFYIHRGDGYNECCLADMWSMLNIFSSTLEELCLDFQGCSDFTEWITADARPLTLAVFEPCLKVTKLSISSVALIRSEDMAKLTSSKFLNLEILTFFNWWVYYDEAIQQNNFQGKYYSGGPTPVTIPGHLGYFWKELPRLQRASVEMKTWKDDYIYEKRRHEMLFIPKNEATYIF